MGGVRVRTGAMSSKEGIQPAGTGIGSQSTGAGGGRVAPLLTQRVLSPRQRRTETPCTQRTAGGGASSAQAEQAEPDRQHSATPPASRQCGQAGGSGEGV